RAIHLATAQAQEAAIDLHRADTAMVIGSLINAFRFGEFIKRLGANALQFQALLQQPGAIAGIVRMPRLAPRALIVDTLLKLHGHEAFDPCDVHSRTRQVRMIGIAPAVMLDRGGEVLLRPLITPLAAGDAAVRGLD